MGITERGAICGQHTFPPPHGKSEEIEKTGNEKKFLGVRGMPAGTGDARFLKESATSPICRGRGGRGGQLHDYVRIFQRRERRLLAIGRAGRKKIRVSGKIQRSNRGSTAGKRETIPYHPDGRGIRPIERFVQKKSL